MKKVFVLTILTLVVPLILNAQESINNFSAENDNIIWQKVFETEMNFMQLKDIVKESGILEDIELGENKILGHTKLIDADFKGAGYSEMSTPMYISRNFLIGFAIIEIKDGKYRVTLKNIILTQQYDDGLSELGEKTPLESFGIKKGKNELKGLFKKRASEILNYTFIKSFTFKQSNMNDDW